MPDDERRVAKNEGSEGARSDHPISSSRSFVLFVFATIRYAVTTVPLRFAILHHTGIDSPHFDFLFEMEPSALLTTFRCPNWPPQLGDEWEERAEHRRAYLDYEGPVSNGRGHVRRVAAGTIEHVVLSSDPVTLGLALDLPDGESLDFSITNALQAGTDSTTRWVVQTLE